MSEPYSLAIYAAIDPARVRPALRSAVSPAATFSDWDALGFALDATDLMTADSATPSTPLRYLQLIRDQGVRDLGWHFSFDVEKNYLTCINLLWTESFTEIIAGFNVMRQLLTAAGDGRPGYVLAHGFAFPANGTFGGVMINGGGSQIQPSMGEQMQSAVRHAGPLAQHMLDTANAIFNSSDYPAIPTGTLTDQLDQMAGG